MQLYMLDLAHTTYSIVKVTQIIQAGGDDVIYLGETSSLKEAERWLLAYNRMCKSDKSRNGLFDPWLFQENEACYTYIYTIAGNNKRPRGFWLEAKGEYL